EKRFDIVGSFLRPDNLKKARNDFENGKIDKAELKKVVKNIYFLLFAIAFIYIKIMIAVIFYL
ncbi:MAG: hypothetical protein K6F69_01470, partial [Treponema sp.]|nr:hypothetical protein [Treponema sp.]